MRAKKANYTISYGFTLTELMIVIAIVAVLATVGVVGYQRYLRNSRQLEMRNIVSLVIQRQESYFQSYGRYCNASGSTGGTLRFDPALTEPEPKAKLWANLPTEWNALGIKPDNDQVFGAYHVRASVGPAHALTGAAPDVHLEAGRPWYYVIAHGDLNGDTTYSPDGGCAGNAVMNDRCTIMYATSQRTEIVTLNAGE